MEAEAKFEKYMRDVMELLREQKMVLESIKKEIERRKENE